MYELLKNKNSFAAKFFSAIFENDSSKIAHAYMLTGNETLAQYYLAMETARLLNCKETRQSSCNCINCGWIKNNNHPAVITVSPIDFNYDSNGGKSDAATVIKVDQARYLRKELSKTSDYHRVIIFTDAKEFDESDSVNNKKWSNYKNRLTPPSTEKNDDLRNWIPTPLSFRTFQAESANTLLKTIEEPSPNITFFFLTNDREDMIDTIVSRCQTIPVLSVAQNYCDLNILDSITEMLPPRSTAQAIFVSEKLTELCKSSSAEQILDNIQEYFRQAVRTNAHKKDSTEYILNAINYAELAKTELKSYVSPTAVLDKLCLNLIISS